MTEKILEKSETKTCESCGRDFSCGAASAKCWCFEVDMSPETLAKLRENFKNCLCQDCLENISKEKAFDAQN
jgi:hypothetical protein